MIELARLCPEIPVTMIMNRADSEQFDNLRDEAPPNVQIIESVAPEHMSDYYRRAFVLVSTSRIEGFANSFLEAGACGTPVLSMDVDPDGFLAMHGCGVLAGGRDSTAAALAQLYDSRQWLPGSLARMLGETSLRYVAAKHEESIIFARFVLLIKSELEKSD